MTKFLAIVFAAAIGLAASLGQAAEFGTKDEAVSMVKRAIAYVKEVGIEKASADFSDLKGKWVDRDLYVAVVDKNGNRVAHGQNPKLIGKSWAESVDVTGKAYGKEGMELANKSGSGWISFTFSDPVTKKQLPKEAYIEKAGDYIYVTGVYTR